jgi:hypothetical protein
MLWYGPSPDRDVTVARNMQAPGREGDVAPRAMRAHQALPPPSAQGDVHDSAVDRLLAAREVRARARESYKDAIGTSSEFESYARVCAAGERVRSRQAWLHWVEDERYHGLNAGPFSLLEETSARTAPGRRLSLDQSEARRVG